MSALIPAVADGLIADAVVLVSRDDPAVAAVAEAVGAVLVVVSGAEWSAGARHAKRDWLLCLDDGDVPTDGWIRTLERFVALSPPSRGFGRLERRRSTLSGRLAHGIRALVAPGRVQAGDLLRRHLLAEGIRPGRPAGVSARIERDPIFDRPETPEGTP